MYMFKIPFTAEAFFMLPLAIGLDLAGLILLCFGLDDFGLTDIIGIIFINGWLLMRGRKGANPGDKKGLINKFVKLLKEDPTRYVVPSIAELIPYLGALPFWTIVVLINLRENE